MLKKSIHVVLLLQVLCLASGTQAATVPFSLRPIFDIEIGNDASLGPDASSNGSGMGARNVASRRRVAYATYDLSEIASPGMVFSNVSFSNYGHDGGTVNVYGVLEDQEHLVTDGITWNTAPGVMNTPTPALDSDVALDLADVTEILLTFEAPARGVRESTETSEALAEFLSSDTNGFVAFMFEGSNAIVRTIDMGPEGGTLLEGLVGGSVRTAAKPSPEMDAEDVYREGRLSWKPGGFAAAHDVYLGLSFDDVNAASVANPLGVLVSPGQDANSYDAGRLALGQTYYWRVDEVNAAPDNSVFKGEVWRFTVEPLAYPLDNVTVTASSSHEDDLGPENTINGVGLNALDQHSTQATDMWLSGAGVQPVWIQYAFDRVHRLHEMWVWNSNQMIEPFIGLGAKDVMVEYSVDGNEWTALAGATQFAQAPGSPTAPTTVLDFAGAAAQYVRITIQSGWGLMGQYGLSEVRFYTIPTLARNPMPESGAADVDPGSVISWRPGREAGQHRVYIGTDAEAVANSTAPSVTVGSNSYDLDGLGLALGQAYYWKVDEVNDSEVPAVWAGEVWDFTTPNFIVVDDFESYGNLSPDRPFQTWIDGVGFTLPEPGNPGNGTGSALGHDIWNASSPYYEGSIMETVAVNSGSQSLPLYFSGAGSQIDRRFSPPQDWTRAGVTTLVLYFFGSPGTTGQLYVEINNSKVPYAGDAGNLARPTWTQWDIDLSSVAGDLQNVQSLSIGLDGNADGMILLDDIRLYALAPPLPAELVWVEAETGTVTAPMQVFPEQDTPGASGTGYVSCPAGTPDEGDGPTYPDGTLTIPFSVAGGTYTARLRVAFPGGDDSCWIRIPTATIDSAVHSSGWIHFNDIPTGEAWHWSQSIKSEDQAGEPPVQFTLAAGAHTMEIAYRGAELKIDVIEFSKVE